MERNSPTNIINETLIHFLKVSVCVKAKTGTVLKTAGPDFIMIKTPYGITMDSSGSFRKKTKKSPGNHKKDTFSSGSNRTGGRNRTDAGFC